MKEATDDDTLRPEVGILNLLDVTLLDAKLEAREPIMTAWDRFQINHNDALILDGCLHGVDVSVDVSVADIKCPREVRASPGQESLRDFFPHNNIFRLPRTAGEALSSTVGNVGRKTTVDANSASTDAATAVVDDDIVSAAVDDVAVGDGVFRTNVVFPTATAVDDGLGDD